MGIVGAEFYLVAAGILWGSPNSSWMFGSQQLTLSEGAPGLG